MAEQFDNTKKCSSRIFKELQKIDSKISPKTTFQQAFEILMEHWDLELSIETSEKITACTIHKDGEDVYNREFNDVWDDKLGDWNLDLIYKTILEHIIKTKLYKRPKIGKRELNRIAKEKAKSQNKSKKIF